MVYDLLPIIAHTFAQLNRFDSQWNRLYSTFADGRSFNRLEYSILGYGGPTLLLVRTTCGGTIGAFASDPWQDAKAFYGYADCFIFELDPKVSVHRSSGTGQNFMYLHSDMFSSSLDFESQEHPKGIGFGGTSTKPRLFIPESFERCSADFMDRTYESGNLLPLEALEKFEIQNLEIWGVGGEDVIKEAFKQREAHRERSKEALHNARVVRDKTQFATDMASGLIPGTIFAHREEVRGRSEFTVDEDHGGYKIERE